MKLNCSQIIVLILCISSNTIRPCCKRRQKKSTGLTVELRKPLSPLDEDLESGRGMQSPRSPTSRYVFDEHIKHDTGAGRGVGLGSPATGMRRRNSVRSGAGTSSMRARTKSDGSGVVDSLDGVHATLASLLARQESTQRKRDLFDKQVYNNTKWAKRFAFIGSFGSIAYTTILHNWPAISKKIFGHGDGPPGSGPSNSTGT